MILLELVYAAKVRTWLEGGQVETEGEDLYT